jgi:hypothetical protein
MISNKMIVENICKMNSEVQKHKINLFNRTDVDTKLNIFKTQKSTFHKLKNIYFDVDNSILNLSSFFIAIDEHIESLNDIDINIIKLRCDSIKAKTQRDKILVYWAVINRLRNEEKFSFRKIADYLKKYHKFDVTHSAIHKVYTKIKEQERGESND